MTVTLRQGDARCAVCGEPMRSGQQVVTLAVWDAFQIGYMRWDKTLHAECVVVQARLSVAAPMLGESR